MILIDRLRRYSRGPFGVDEWCHMMTDNLGPDGLQELHCFAQRAGLPARAYQPHRRFPHYDLTAERREQVLALGAQEVDSRELIRRCRRDGVTRGR